MGELSVAVAARANEPNPTRLRGAWLLTARAAWLVLFAVNLGTFALLFPTFFSTFQHTCAVDCFFTDQSAQALRQVGVSLHTYAWIILVSYSVLVFVSSLLALLLFWRRSDDWLALTVALFLVVYPISNLLAGSTAIPIYAPTLEGIGQFLLTVPSTLAFCLVFLIFPSGRFVPRWSWLLLILFLAFDTALSFSLFDPYIVVGYPLLFGSFIVCQVHRYRRVSTGAERQQTKWVVFGFAASLVANQAFWLPSGLTPLGNTIYTPISYLIYLVFLLLLPVTFYIAMQRHQLFDIDVIINRTLVYGSVTAILVAIYVGVVIGLQNAFHAVTGQDSTLAIVISTLLIAALFQPLRARIQQVVDRRFYRTKYDAQQTLAAFSATLRSQVDLATVREQVVAVVERTMRPTHVSLWLREPGRRHDTAEIGEGAGPHANVKG